MMSPPSTNAAMVAFEDSALGSASAEFSRLDPKLQELFFRHLDQVLSGEQDHWSFAPFDSYQGIPVYRAEIDGSMMIYAVEEQSLGDRKLTVLFCGELGQPVSAGTGSWDGANLEALRGAIVRPRLGVWFR